MTEESANGVWDVWKVNPMDYLGMFQTRIGDEVLILDPKTAQLITLGTILHMDERHSQRSLEVQIMENFRGRRYEFTIKITSDCCPRYPDRQVFA